jgi:4'-phosphopantetheinyl transferase
MSAAPGPQLRWISLDAEAARLSAYASLLDTEERTRAGRYAFEQDRRRFTITRAVLRITLADALGIAPAALRFGSTPYHKPFVAWPREGRGLHFNVSHAGDFALIATAQRHSIGVDVERVRDDVDCAQMAERIFSTRERAALAEVAQTARPRAFFDLWTRKEAYVKARGLGLSLPLDSFDVALNHPKTANAARSLLLATRPDAGDVARWTVRALPAPAGYVAAFAYAVGADAGIGADAGAEREAISA